MVAHKLLIVFRSTIHHEYQNSRRKVYCSTGDIERPEFSLTHLENEKHLPEKGYKGHLKESQTFLNASLNPFKDLNKYLNEHHTSNHLFLSQISNLPGCYEIAYYNKLLLSISFVSDFLRVDLLRFFNLLMCKVLNRKIKV